MTEQNAPLEAKFQVALTELEPVLSVGDSVQELLGYRPEQFLDGRISLRTLIHRDDCDLADALFARKITPVKGNINIRLRQANGLIRCLRGQYEKRLDESDHTIVLELLLQDAKYLQQSLERQTVMANFAAMMENTDDFIFFKDRNHVFTGASQTLVALTDPAEHWTDLIGKTDYDVFPEEYADTYYRLEKQVFEGMLVAHEVQQTLFKDGKKGWIDNRKYPIRNAAGEIVGLFGIARDITGKKQVEDVLAESERRFRSIFENVPSISVQGYNKDRQAIFWNPASEKLYGYSREQALGQRLENLTIPPPMREAVVRLVSEWVEGGLAIPAAERILKNASGESVEVFSSHVLLQKESGEPELYCLDIDISERKRIAAELAQEQYFTTSILDNLPGIFYLYTYPECRLVLWNKQHELLLGYPAGEMAGRHVSDWHVPEAKEAVLAAVDKVMRSGQSAMEAPLVAKDGRLVYFALTGARFEAKNQSYFLGIGTDITARKQLEKEQKEALKSLQKISSRVPGVVYQFRLRPDGSSCFPYASEALREIYRLDPEDVREDASGMYVALHPDDLEDVVASVQRSAQDLTPWRQDYRVRFEDGAVHWLSGSALPEREADGSVLWHGFITDITERKRLEEQVRQMAFYDLLTELPNRRLLSDRLDQALAASERSGCYGALMFLDLDNFKPLNDAHGHEAGDLLLIQVADRLKRCVRGMDTVARFGGDEFVVMISELNMDKAASAAKAGAIAEKIRITLSEPYRLTVKLDGEIETQLEHHCTASIGVNLFVGNEKNPDEILRGADKAMYRAKEMGRNSVRFSPEFPQESCLSGNVSTNFVQLVWRSDYECGNAVIDEQHRALFGDANKLITVILSDLPAKDMCALVDRLVHDVVQHFSDEETIFTAAAYPGAVKHATLHRQLVARATVLVSHFHAGNLAIGELFQFLAHDVISQHLLKADREFFPCLKTLSH